ncbi:MAG: hypothetical protein V3V31_12195 [Methylococcales bacterium]
MRQLNGVYIQALNNDVFREKMRVENGHSWAREVYYKLKQKNSSHGNDERAKKIRVWIEKVEERFQDRTVSIDMELLDNWANLCGSSEAEGKKLPVLDSLLVATAQIHSMVVVTRNVADFQNCSKTLRIFNPY